MESGKQGRWEGLGWHIALETEMNRAVNRRQRVLGRRLGTQSKRGHSLGKEQGREASRERRAGLGSSLKQRQSCLYSQGAMEDSKAPRRPGQTQALLRTRVMVHEAAPRSGTKTPFGTLTLGESNSTLCRQNEDSVSLHTIYGS